MSNALIRAVIGLGNPGPTYVKHRHNIGFRVLDALAECHGGSWRTAGEAETTSVSIGDHEVVLMKPLAGMNLSGKVYGALKKKGIEAANILVVHDEMELPFGKLAIRQGGSARGHNGLRSLIGVCGPDFYRLRFGVSRPERREDVPVYVLSNFSENAATVAAKIDEARDLIEDFIARGTSSSS